MMTIRNYEKPFLGSDEYEISLEQILFMENFMVPNKKISDVEF